MIIRQEIQADYCDVYNIIKQAFASVKHSDGNEQDLVCKLRMSNNFIPELSLVAVENSKIIGHILFTKAYVGNDIVLALAPLSVLPSFQKKGVGTALIKQGHMLAKNMGYKLSVVLGSEKYYSKAGYTPASQYGIFSPFDVPDKNFMAVNLSESPVRYNGILKYAKEFFEE